MRCEYPGCDWVTENRSAIHWHHIVPRELGGGDEDKNRIWLCPNHHSRIRVEGSSGIHSKGDLEIIGYRMSTMGVLIEYVEGGEVKYFARGK